MTAIAYPGPQHTSVVPEVPAIAHITPRLEPETVEIDFGRLLLTSVLTTAVVMFLGVGVPMWALTGQIWDGIGLGAFTAFWGGPGFGLMAAGAIWAARTEND